MILLLIRLGGFGCLGSLGRAPLALFSLGGTGARRKSRVLPLIIVKKNPKCNVTRSVLVSLADHLKFKIDQGQVSFLPIYQSVYSKVASLDLLAVQGAKVRSRIKWAEEGETSSRYFLKLEKRGSLDWISAMKESDGAVVSDLDGISNSWSDFYSTLFSACHIDQMVQADLLSNVFSSLPADQASVCDGYLTVGEVRSALNGMARGKSPASDGIPMEFYLAFSDTLGSDLVDVLNASFDLGFLPPSQLVAF